MAKLQTSKSAAMLRSMSMGHHGKALLQKLDVNKLTTKERVFPSLDDTAGNSYNHYGGHTKSMTDAEKQKLLRSKKLKKIVRSIHKEKQQTSRGRFKQNLRPNAYHKISGCTF